MLIHLHAARRQQLSGLVEFRRLLIALQLALQFLFTRGEALRRISKIAQHGQLGLIEKHSTLQFVKVESSGLSNVGESLGAMRTLKGFQFDRAENPFCQASQVVRLENVSER